ncbi:MAG: hypothetical protein V3T35_11320 [Spirochaetia bacterium]
MKRFLLPLAIVSLFFAVSCSRLSVTPPEGFAELKGRSTYRAVSPEGILYRIRTVKNKPQKDLEFWSEALENHLAKEGYRLNGDPRPFQNGNRAGLSFEWVLPYGNDSYLYLTALIVSDKTITLAEATAPYSVFIRYRQPLLDSLASIQPRR